MQVTSIRSTQNPKVKNLVRLRDGNHRRRQRRFLVEGRREISRALEARTDLIELYFAPEYFGSDIEDAVLRSASDAGVALFRLSRDAFQKVAYRARPDGLLALAIQWETSIDALRLSADPLLLVSEKIEKPGNLGGLLRTADAAGCDAVIVTDPVTDVFNPNVIRASQGALFSMPLAVSDNASSLAFFRNLGIRVIATSPDASRNLWEADFASASAVVVGSEQDGLSPFWLKNCDQAISIPMLGRANSINVAAAAAAALFEAVRQRRSI